MKHQGALQRLAEQRLLVFLQRGAAFSPSWRWRPLRPVLGIGGEARVTALPPGPSFHFLFNGRRKQAPGSIPNLPYVMQMYPELLPVL